MKGEGKEPTKVVAASTTETKKPPAIKPPPTTMPLPKNVGRMYTNWKQEPAKFALARSIEVKLKVLDPQLEAGDVIIPDRTLLYHVRYSKEEAKKRGVSFIIYLNYSARGKTKTLTAELDRIYIQQLITLCNLKNNGMSIMEFIGVIQKMTKAYFKKAE